jgi:hypothetical protein
MKATLKEQTFRLVLKVTQARIFLLQDISDTVVKINVAFIATHWCKNELQMVTPEGETEPSETLVEVATPLNLPIVVDESQHDIPFELWVGLWTCISTPELIPTINLALDQFNALFVNSMQGMDLEVTAIEMG